MMMTTTVTIYFIFYFFIFFIFLFNVLLNDTLNSSLLTTIPALDIRSHESPLRYRSNWSHTWCTLRTVLFYSFFFLFFFFLFLKQQKLF